mmetsp:Transcript_10108/g.14824  ORF Transcript_10108/g.14824 Transcript_10108/m.14824 type:complete len:348 (-) Transcript_10108:47-1090(-)
MTMRESSHIPTEVEERVKEENGGKVKKSKKRTTRASTHAMILGMDADEEEGHRGSFGVESAGSSSKKKGENRRYWFGGWASGGMVTDMEGEEEKKGAKKKSSVDFDEHDESLLLHQQVEEAAEEDEVGSYCPPALLQSPSNETSTEAFLEEEGVIMDECSFFYEGFDSSELSKRRRQHKYPDERQRKLARDRSRAAFLASHHHLNATLPLMPGSAASRSGLLPHQSDVSYQPHVRGKAHIHRTTDYVRLVMDPFLEPGILSVEHRDSSVNYDPAKPLQPLQYVLTVDEHLYRRVLREVAQSESTPCGLYFCCHDDADSNKAHISVAIALLSVVFLFLLVNTLIWPID